MDLMTFLQRLEADFFSRLNKKTGWGKEEVKKEFNEAIKNVLVVTYSSVMKDVGELQKRADELSILSGVGTERKKNAPGRS